MYKTTRDILWVDGKAIDLRDANQKTLKLIAKKFPSIVYKESKADANTDTEPSESNGSIDTE